MIVLFIRPLPPSPVCAPISSPLYLGSLPWFLRSQSCPRIIIQIVIPLHKSFCCSESILVSMGPICLSVFLMSWCALKTRRILCSVPEERVFEHQHQLVSPQMFIYLHVFPNVQYLKSGECEGAVTSSNRTFGLYLAPVLYSNEVQILHCST